MGKSTATPTPYPELNAVLGELVRGVKAPLGENFVAAWLQGSFAVGDFDMNSDVDFIVAVHEEMTDGQVEALQAMHERIYNMDYPWAQHLEGSYFPKDTLKDYTQAGRPLWYLDHGSRTLERSDHCNTVVVRWVLREHGVILAGPDPVKLIRPIPVQALRKEILATICDWGQEILDDPEKFNNRFYQGFIVLSYCRMLRDLHFGTTGSKLEGAEWAKAVLDSSWVSLIDRTWATRPDPALSVREPPDADDFKLTLEFVQHVMKLAMEYAADAQHAGTWDKRHDTEPN
jgi:hypothetical protein